MVIIINLLFIFMNKKSKLFMGFYIFFIWFLMAGSMDNPDYGNYYNQFQRISVYGTDMYDLNSEYGFQWMMKLVSLFTEDYNYFLIIVFFIAISLICSFLYDKCLNKSYICILYLIFPLIYDLIQIRNFMAMSIIIFSLKYIFNQNFKSKIYFCIGTLVATSIHYSAFLYFPLVFIDVYGKNKKIRFMALGAMGISLYFIFNINALNPVIDLVAFVINSEKNLAILEARSNLGFLIPYAEHMLMFSMIVISRRICFLQFEVRKDLSRIQIEKYKKYINLVYYIDLLAFIYFPLHLINISFVRLIRNLLILNYGVFAITIGMTKNKNSYFLLVLLFVSLFYFLEYMHAPPELFYLQLQEMFIYNNFLE